MGTTKLGRRALLLAAGAIALPGRVRAAGTLTLMVGAPAGSSVDTAARSFAPFLERHLPRTDLIIANVAGDSGLVAYSALATAAPTGSALGWVATPSLPARMVDRGGKDLMERLILLGAISKEPVVIVSPAASPLTSAAELFKRAATDADSVPFGTPPAGSPPHLAALRLQMLAKTQLNIVAFPSSAAARQAVLAGNVAAAVLALGDAIGGLREGKLTGLGIAARQPLEAFPDMPRLQDIGLPLNASIWRGLAAPAGTPKEALAPVIAALQAIVADPEFVDQGGDGGFIAHWLDGAAWTELAAGERAELARLWENAPWLPTGAG